MNEWFERCTVLVPIGLAACVHTARIPLSRATVTPLRGSVVVDGRLTERCYSQPPFVSRFVVAGSPERRAPKTKAWLFWDSKRLVFAFDVADADIVAASESGHERDVDAQDRVELFLWSGRIDDAYYCIEIGARDAVHDYAARFYRQFDDRWQPADWKHAVAATPAGYSVEGELSRAALEGIGLKLTPGASFRLGLFRADFRTGAPKDPTWICWVDAHGPQPDFHVAASFGEVTLSAESP